jgi:Lrp/AsnC family leucine-responsive transcriptional regulator
MVAGGFDYLIKTRVQDMDEYRRVLGDKIVNVRGVRHTQTYFVLEEVKSTHAVRVRVSDAGRAATAATPKRRRARS